MNTYGHEKYLRIALDEAKKSDKDVPVAAVLVKDGEIIAKASNKKEADNDPTAHAEMIVIKQAAKKLNTTILDGTALYVTLEPCPMCACAILYSRIPLVVFGASDQLYGAFGSVLNMSDYIKHKPSVIQGILEQECSDLIKCFFKQVRKNPV